MSALTGVRNGLLRVEAAWWMSRTFLSNLATWAAVIGWCAADPDLDSWGRMLSLTVAVIALNGAMFIVNDLLDSEGDEVTAPYLPLPSGLLTRSQAWLAMVAGILIAVVTVTLAATSNGRLATAAGLLVLGILLSAAYSKVKDFGVWGSITVALPQSMPAVVAWVLAGGGPVGEALLALAYLLLASVSNNILAALRDVEKDPEAGYRTLAVRVGPGWAFRWAALTGFAALVPVVVLAVIRPGWWALAFTAAGLFLQLYCYPRLLGNFTQSDRGRTQRLADQRLWKLGEYMKHGSVIAAFNPLAGLISTVILYACLRGGYHVYNTRLVGGAIRRSLTGPVPVLARD